MLDKKQFRILKSLNKLNSIECSEISDSDMEIYEFLKSLGYVKIEYNYFTCPGRDGHLSAIPTTPIRVSMAQPGKAYLASEKGRKLEIWIPHTINFIISIVALFFSLISLSTTAPEVWQSIQNFFH